ncbi:MAG: sulfotransferase family 2 domain-containing protein [Methylovulum sp.]|nr:sulfotransferase family 2 domain-containing protein [Methylovulum sp.]
MKFTLATCVRNEGPYLLEWVAHYKLLGFDRIIIFSNDNDDGSDELLAAMEKKQLIDWRPRTLAPDESPQLSAFRALSKELMADSSEHGGYLAWFDCDEFLALKMDASVQDLLGRYQFPDALFINWKHFGSSSKQNYERDLTVSRFVCCDSQTLLNTFGKSISRLNPSLYKFISNHRPIPLKNDTWGRIVYAANQADDVLLGKDVVYGNNPRKNSQSPVFHDVCQLNHYAIRSKEEYGWKSIRGNGRLALDNEKKQFSNIYFKEHDLNNEIEPFTSERYKSAITGYINTLPIDLKALDDNIVDALVKRYRSVMADDMPVNSVMADHLPAKKAIPTIQSHWLSIEDQQQRLRGYAVDVVEKRLSYGSFVGDKSNYVFVETPKAACSTMKWVLADLENRQVQLRHAGKNSDTTMIVHLRSSHRIKSLMQLNGVDRSKLLNQAGIVRFCVVRNPYARVASAWADKIRQKEPGYEKIWGNVAKYLGDDPKVCPTFADFVRWMAGTQNPKSCNPHWRPMVNLLLPELLNYTHILHTEKLASELQEVLNQIAPGQDANALLEKHRANESLPIDWPAYYDEETANLVASFYQDDFVQYGYSLTSWKPETKIINLADEINTLREKINKYEHAALNAIRSRNDVIIELIKKNHSVSNETVIPKTLNPPKKTILVLGDSHVKIFKRPNWLNIGSEIKWEVVSVEGATLSGLENPNSKTQAGVQFNEALSKHNADVIVLCLGEVDTGFVIWFRAEKDAVQVQQAAQRAVDNYCRLIESARLKAEVVVVSTPLPTLPDGSTEGAIAKARAEVTATQQQRTELTCWFNAQIKNWCEAKSISYVSLDDLSKGDDGLVSPALRHANPRDHHYNPKQYRKLLKENMLPVIRKLMRL